MKRSLVALLAVLVLVSAGCSAPKYSTAASPGGGREDMAYEEMGTSNMSMGIASAPAPAATPSAPSTDMALEGGKGESGGGSSVYNSSDAKLIRRGDISIQTTEFDKSVQSLESLMGSFQGYFEHAVVYGGDFYNTNANRRGEYTLRIPAKSFDAFYEASGELGYLTRSSQSTQNISEEYYDTQARLETQRIKQERLQSLLERAETMEDIISIESALSEVEYTIEYLSSAMNRYDTLVDYATISLYLEEVIHLDKTVGEGASLAERIGAGLAQSVKNVVYGVQNFIVWIAYNFFGILIFAGVAVAVAFGVKTGLKKVKKRKSDL